MMSKTYSQQIYDIAKSIQDKIKQMMVEPEYDKEFLKRMNEAQLLLMQAGMKLTEPTQADIVSANKSLSEVITETF
ncbi:hypothetical protein AGMMS49944_08040 [Spirochaetia bacterium]|nr:hypothetical protein AGMMS49944_08040 [Spirochaetia bacterium]